MRAFLHGDLINQGIFALGIQTSRSCWWRRSSATSTASFDLGRTECSQESQCHVQDFLDSVKEDCQANSMKTMFDTVAAIHRRA